MLSTVVEGQPPRLNASAEGFFPTAGEVRKIRTFRDLLAGSPMKWNSERHYNPTRLVLENEVTLGASRRGKEEARCSG